MHVPSWSICGFFLFSVQIDTHNLIFLLDIASGAVTGELLAEVYLLRLFHEFKLVRTVVSSTPLHLSAASCLHLLLVL